MNSIKEMISGGKLVHFVRYQKKELWYVTECGFEFPVPLDDTGDGAFLASDKASFFMRWINAQIKAIKTAQLECI